MSERLYSKVREGEVVCGDDGWIRVDAATSQNGVVTLSGIDIDSLAPASISGAAGSYITVMRQRSGRR